MVKFSFATKPRYIGELAKAKYEESETLLKVWGPTSSPAYIENQKNTQQKIKAIVNNYNLGYLTGDETIVAILETANGPRLTT